MSPESRESYAALVQRISGELEGQKLEFKAADILSRPERLLRSVVGMLNAEGGEIIVGVGEEDGRASSFVGVEQPEREQNRLRDILLDRIRPSINPQIDLVRIPGTQRALMIVRVPEGSPAPYAYTTREQAFVVVRRSGDRLRPVGWAEVLEGARSTPTEDRLREGQGELRQRVDDTAKKHRSVWLLIAMPLDPEGLRIGDEIIKRAMEDPKETGIRRDGWTFLSGDSPRQRQDRLETGVEADARDGRPYRHLRVKRNGAMEFLTGLDSLERGSSARGGKDGWSLYPYAVVEQPASLLRLLARLYEGMKPEKKVLLQSVFIGIKGSTLAPYRPGALFPKSELEPFPEELLYCPEEPLAVTIGEIRNNPDRIAFRIVRNLYEAFGYEDDKIPFYESAQDRFVFG